MKKKIAILIAITIVLSFCIFFSSAAWAGGATQEALAYKWNFNDGMLQDPLGKVIYVQPGDRDKLNVTWILQGAQASTNYLVGFNLFMADAPQVFGVVKTGQATGTVGVYDTAGYYIVGSVETDSDGDGSLHVNLKNLPANCYDIVFWIIPQPGSLYPEAATMYWGGPALELNWEEVCIP